MVTLPNPPELILLKALWRHGPMPVRRLHEECVDELGWSFSSTRKTLSRMVDKDMVAMEEVGENSRGPTLYRARLSKTMALTKLSRDFLYRVLETEGPIPHNIFAASRLLSDDELEELEGLL